MNIFQAEIKYYLRSPLIWVVVALSSFISAWSFLLAIDIFTTMQVKFAGMTDAPTIVQGIIIPVISAQSKLLLLIAPIIAGLSFARLSSNNGWTLINANLSSEFSYVKQKYTAIFSLSLIFLIPSLVGIILLVIMAKISIYQLSFAFLGLLLLMMWMLSLCMYISSLINNSGFAILMCLVILLVLWVLSFSGIDATWGKNWIQVFSPQYHFQKFLTPYVPYSSFVYFIAGTVFSLWATKIRLIHKRYVLS